jgi:Trypsin-like peptidase domain
MKGSTRSGALILFLAIHILTLRGQDLPALHLSHDSTVRVFSVSGNSSGSGSLISDTLVLTCLHVVVKVEPVGQNVNLVKLQDISVILPSGEIIPASIVSFPTPQDPDPSNYDFAYLRLEHKPTKPFKKVDLANDHEEAQLGDNVVFSGYPLNTLECPATFVPVEMRQTGMRGTGYGTREEAYGGADRESAATG